MRKKVVGIVLCVAMLTIWCPVTGQIMPKTFEVDRAKVVEKKVKTVYDHNGRPINQGQDRKGWHRVGGSVTLSSGRAIVTLNTSAAEGRQDVGFISDSTYAGTAWSLDTNNGKTYKIYAV